MEQQTKTTRELALAWFANLPNEKRDKLLHPFNEDGIEELYLSENPQTETIKEEDVQVGSEYETAIRNACLVALEFGYVQCEKGNNLDMAIMNYNKIISNK